MERHPLGLSLSGRPVLSFRTMTFAEQGRFFRVGAVDQRGADGMVASVGGRPYRQPSGGAIETSYRKA